MPFVEESMMIDASSLNVSFTFVALCTFVPFVLTGWIGARRGKLDVLRGHGDDATLFLRSRIHGNFVENAPIVALALLVGELAGIGDGWLWAVVGTFFVGRVLHAMRFDHKDRALGMTLSTAPSFALGVAVLLTV